MSNSDGGTLSFPIRVDVRGTLAVARTREQITNEAIIDLLETPTGARVMLPEYGVRDFVFATVNAGFGPRLSYNLKRQILDYVPEVADVDVSVEVADANQLEVFISYRLRSGATHSLVYPLWQLRAGN